MDKLSLYNSIRSIIQDGDAFLWSGKGRESNLIKRFTNSKYSHISLCLWLNIESLPNERLFTFESTTLNTLPSIDSSYRRGTQIVPLSQRVDAYEGEIYWAPLCKPLDDVEKKFLSQWCMKRYADYIPYDKARAIRAGIDVEKLPWPLNFIAYPFAKFFTNRQSMDFGFCSELYAAALQQVGRIDPKINASEQTPQDIVNLGCFKEIIQLIY